MSGTDLKKMKLNRSVRPAIYFLLLLFVLGDLGYSFIQHSNQPLDGDMAGGIVPAEDVKMVLKHPLGLEALISGQTYSNPNKFFSHWIFKEYFTAVPVALQNFTQPIESVYLSCALAKTAIQAALIFLLAFVVSGTGSVFRLDFMAAAALVTPLFQTNGYRGYMGIIDTSTTYTFFYALPIVLLLLYFLPLLCRYYQDKQQDLPLPAKILWIPLALVVCLSGPLNPGIALILSGMLIVYALRKNYPDAGQDGFIRKMLLSIRRIPKSYWFYLLPVSILSLYSLYIGQYNVINDGHPATVTSLYFKLPEGIYNQFTQKLGFPVLFIILIINAIWISRKFKTTEGSKILQLYKWIGLFALIYILLLPLGGYREYRPLVLRFDTILPVTLSLIFLFGASTLFLLKNINRSKRFWYVPGIVAMMLIFTFADKADSHKNQCEKNALQQIARSTETTIAIPNDCTVLSWWKIKNPEASEMNARLLNQWRITKEKRLYYNR